MRNMYKGVLWPRVKKENDWQAVRGKEKVPHVNSNVAEEQFQLPTHSGVFFNSHPLIWRWVYGSPGSEL